MDPISAGNNATFQENSVVLFFAVGCLKNLIVHSRTFALLFQHDKQEKLSIIMYYQWHFAPLPFLNDSSFHQANKHTGSRARGYLLTRFLPRHIVVAFQDWLMTYRRRVSFQNAKQKFHFFFAFAVRKVRRHRD
jgi:hypothetical protein